MAGGVKIADRNLVISNCRVSRESCVKSILRLFPGRGDLVFLTVLTEIIFLVCAEDRDHCGGCGQFERVISHPKAV